MTGGCASWIGRGACRGNGWRQHGYAPGIRKKGKTYDRVAVAVAAVEVNVEGVVGGVNGGVGPTGKDRFHALANEALEGVLVGRESRGRVRWRDGALKKGATTDLQCALHRLHGGGGSLRRCAGVRASVVLDFDQVPLNMGRVQSPRLVGMRTDDRRVLRLRSRRWRRRPRTKLGGACEGSRGECVQWDKTHNAGGRDQRQRGHCSNRLEQRRERRLVVGRAGERMREERRMKRGEAKETRQGMWNGQAR